MLKKTLYITCLLSLFCSCRLIHNKKVINFANMEIEIKKTIINDILSSLDIENADIYCIAHLRYGEDELSKQLQTETCSGMNFAPEGPPGAEGSLREYTAGDDNGSYSRYDLNVNYDESIKRTVVLDYISYLIIIDEKYMDKTVRVENSLKTVILNRQRADVLVVMTK